MNRKTLAFLSLAAMLTTAGYALAEDMPGMNMTPATPPASQPASQPAAIDLGNTVCPVSGGAVGDSKLTEVYEGKTYHFCCADCPGPFKKDPAKYAKLVAADPAKYGVKNGK